MPINIRVNRCRVYCSSGSHAWRFDRAYGWGCDLVIRDSVKDLLILVEAKDGRITLSDANKAIKQLQDSYSVLVSQHQPHKIVKVFVHCSRGRIDGYAQKALMKSRVYVVKSYEDISKSILE